VAKEKRERDPSELLGGMLNIFGLKVDLGDLLSSPENLRDRLEQLREKLKEAGGTEVLSDEEWRRGAGSVTGHIRIRGIRGEEEYHVGTLGKRGRGASGRRMPEPPDVLEPPIDVFDEAGEITIVADVPGVKLEDLQLEVEGSEFRLSTKAGTGRSYRKELQLEADLDPGSLRSTCNNGVLEVRLRKRGGS
jgi:HSP20 family protein